MDLCYNTLKPLHREIREEMPTNQTLRIHRALSWLQRAEQESEDLDARFIFLWIAFNAAYANDIDDRQSFSERRVFSQFLQRLIDQDTDRQLYKILWQDYPNAIRIFIDNKYVYQPFWEYQKGNISQEEWEKTFADSKAAAHRALGNQNTQLILGVIFERLYVLRNQLLHGGATWNGSANRNQIRDGAAIMGRLVPLMIYLMMMDKSPVWGDPCYPVVSE
jgi:hypothetical protein